MPTIRTKEFIKELATTGKRKVMLVGGFVSDDVREGNLQDIRDRGYIPQIEEWGVSQWKAQT